VTFDPFGDFATRGYLRNVAGEKDLQIVRRLEHTSFLTGIDAAFRRLSIVQHLSYEDVLETHKILFEAVYPWAGQDRLQIAPELAVGKGPVLFARPADIRRAIDYALDKGQDKGVMFAKAGEVMGYLAYGHPFLDGNGRTIMIVHAVMSQRAGFSVDWAATSKSGYLESLTKELDAPGDGHLDTYLRPFIREAMADHLLALNIIEAPGLDGEVDQNEVLGKTSEPSLRARYEQQEIKRHRDKPPPP
jgi:cell filamentation protein, protein adenylyltransferase